MKEKDKEVKRQKKKEETDGQMDGRGRSLTSCGAAASGRCTGSGPPAGSLVLEHTAISHNLSRYDTCTAKLYWLQLNSPEMCSGSQ